MSSADPFAAEGSVQPASGKEFTHLDIVLAVDRLAGRISHLDEWVQEQRRQSAMLMQKIDTMERIALQCVTPDSIDRGLSHLRIEIEKEVTINKIVADKAIADHEKTLAEYKTEVTGKLDRLQLWVFMMAGGLVLGGALLAAGVIDLRSTVKHPPSMEQSK